MRSGFTGIRRLAAAMTTAAALLVAVPAAPAQAATGPSGIGAKGAILLDASNGKALWSKSADTSRQMASTTKIMTAAVVLSTKGVNLNRQITIKKEYRSYVANKGASTADLRTGDKLTVSQLLYALLLPSGCDAAYALADNFGTGKTMAARTSDFIAKMNAKAKSLGLKGTHYDSFDGISSKGKNYTTPRSLALLTRYAMDNKTFRTVVASTKTSQKATNGRVYTWYNTNKLLGAYKGAVGVKTGTSTPAGPCLVFAANRNGRLVIGVLLNDSKDRFKDAATMLNWTYGVKKAATTTFVPRSLPKGAPTD
ncbi:D-alanyl-D-alanine carboxypeptidase family protein [Peterkaempfera bronchialis]|uniref:D-alanyl-D-alanine carboxypeptidase n=1 Tax=Peterkaempfera bronchialis TaxID=2126346 RepID=A0A345SYJ2_9ACTN|nr:serine hydrolase [Peterkaempfera bronchialis]AXI78797.1 D-alanyl-D-alanine carboxypeptidase [Peterkaempfera bronchialis]